MGIIVAIIGSGLFLAAVAIALVFVNRGKSSASAELTSSKPMALVDAGSAVDISSLSPIDSAADSAAPVGSADVAHTTSTKAAQSATAVASTKPIASTPASHADTATLTRDQKHRLESLQRLCDQGTFTPAECQAKRAQITQGP